MLIEFHLTPVLPLKDIPRFVTFSEPAQTNLERHVSLAFEDAGYHRRYTVREEPLGTVRPIRIITIGAGASGINILKTLDQELTNFDCVVYEKNSRVGGTWFENRYPGCQCDIPSHNYQFSYQPNYAWSSFFSPAREIEEYLCSICEDASMKERIRLEHEVLGAFWNEDTASWRVQIRSLRTGVEFEDHCDFLLNASGILNNWQWPDIPGLHDFAGSLLHSAKWDETFEWAGKRVAVIGNGSSGVQIVPAMQESVRELVHFIREPTWMVPPQLQSLSLSKASDILSQIQMDEKGRFLPEQIQRFKLDPDFYLSFIKAVEEQVNNNFSIVLKDTTNHRNARELVTHYMKSSLGDNEELIKLLVPDFPLGCRRMTPDIGYLASLTKDNVRVVSDKIVVINETGLVTSSGETIAVDAIVCATGFNVSFRPRFPLVGRKGNLQDIWTETHPSAYMSCAVPDFPNYFVFLGPNAPIGHGSVFTIVELISKYVTDIIKKCQTQQIRAISPSRAAVDEFAEHIATFMPRTAWAGPCASWFKAGTRDGPVTALHPGSRIHFFHMLEHFRGEDWEYVYSTKTNRFSYLGNGVSLKELDGSDTTWYLRA
ncbi:FAD/NAD(P)-binding domain-containing protein [Aaosphaeria arxii CBS 175.79]|uniref:FAD/NAD(P)-binding domain-containing protein n=1 Tax=Aaosphaeria arxii CBS 175.79 TaxID=1450172 RepID=A0A6A5XLY0_9PLEO|nr:FAD/NAD(P)-binding domain-containing protein [Aaosphaeria arxii CBS 175.79]KAF2014268.1 FAD/NAD(P)-binding domain-containing protein [Aaosphaeria arxii CBS 175.79]